MNKELLKYLKELIMNDAGIKEEEINLYLAGKFGNDVVLEDEKSNIKDYLDDKFRYADH